MKKMHLLLFIILFTCNVSKWPCVFNASASTKYRRLKPLSLHRDPETLKWGAACAERSLLGKTAFGSLVHVWPGWRFQLMRSFGHAGKFSQYWFDGNANAVQVMWALLRRGGPSRQYSPSVPKAQAVAPRRRKFKGARSAARRPGTSRLGPVAARARCPERHDATGARS
jgi:hypothetical protein